MKAYLDKVGSLGAVFAGAACPACFPQLAALGAVFDLGALGSYEGQIFLATQVLVVLGILGHALAYRAHRTVWLALLGAGGGVLFFIGMDVLRSEATIYVGLGAMVLASILDLLKRYLAKRSSRLSTEAR